MSEQIITLSDREQCRQKLPVFFGSNDNSLHAVRECVINARDILKKQLEGKIEVFLSEDCKTVTIKDNGIGLPMIGETETILQNGEKITIPNWKLLFLTLFSGTKMEDGNDDGGTNGCGNTIICYTSDYFQANVKKDGYEYQITFNNGGEIIEEFHCLGETNEQGTTITFRLSDEVYTSNVFKPEDIELIVEKVCATLYNISADFTYNNETKSFSYSDLEDYFNTHSNNKALEDNIVINKKIFETENLKSKVKIEKTEPEIVFNFSEEPIQHSFLNGIYLIEKGKVHDGVIEGVKKQFNKFIRTEGLYEKKEKAISNQDIEQNISYAITVSSSHVSFSNQTKFGTKKELYKEIVQKYINDFLETYFIENKANALIIANKLLISKRANEKADQIRLDTKKKLQSKSNGLSPKIAGLKDCDMRNSEMEEREFRITEGVSPSSTVIDARDPRIMGVYGLRGKFISSLKKSIKEVLNNEPALGIINGLGCGIKMSKEEKKIYKNIDSFDIENLRYGKIFIDTDMDEWGYGIALSLIMFFYVYMPDLLEQGRIYLSVSPRYEIETNKKDKNGEFITLFAYDEKGKEKIINQLEKEGSKYIINIVKGLGQLNKDIFWDYVLDKNNRICKQIICKDIKNGNLEILFNTLMGEDIVSRKKYVKDHITNLNIEELD